MLSNFVEASIFPVRNPCPSGLQGTKPIPNSSQVGSTVGFRVSRPNRILALNCGDRLDRVCAANGVCSGLRKAEVLDLAGLNQMLDRASDILDGHVWIDTVLVEEIDDVGLEAFE